MLKLQTKSLRDFQKQAALLPSNTILPICSNLKIDFENNLCIVKKETIESSVSGQVQFTDTGDYSSYLINERILFSLINTTKNDEIYISRSDNSILLETLNPADKITLPFEDPISFPARQQLKEENIFKLNKNHIDSIKIAKNFIDVLATAGAFKFIHLHNDCIFALNHFYFYINSSFENLPFTSFNKLESEIISAYESIEFMDSPGFHTFYVPGYTFTFSKAELTIPNENTILERLRLPGKECSFNKNDFTDFISLANNISESEISYCSFYKNGNSLKLKMDDSQFGRNSERVLFGTGEPDEFYFNGRNIVNQFQAIPYEIINAKTNQNCLIINNLDEWFCFIGISKK